MAAGDWDALALADDTLKGMAPVDFMDADHDEFDTDKKTDEYVSAAKRLIETRLMKDLPELVVRAEGPKAFLDAATTITNVAAPIQQMLGWSFLIHYYRQEMFSNTDKFFFLMEESKGSFEVAFTGFASYMQRDEDFLDALEATSSSDLGKFDDPVYVG